MNRAEFDAALVHVVDKMMAPQRAGAIQEVGTGKFIPVMSDSGWFSIKHRVGESCASRGEAAAVAGKALVTLRDELTALLSSPEQSNMRKFWGLPEEVPNA